MRLTDEQQALYMRLAAKSTWVEAYCGVDMNRLPVRGQMLLVGPCMAPLAYRVGFVVQIRLKQGDFGSHNFLIRMLDGSLHQHSNNCFNAIKAEDELALLLEFKMKPDSEDYEQGYSIGSPDSQAAGFLVARESDYPRNGDGTQPSISLVNSKGSVEMAQLVYI